jgi:hypothetical protein
MHHNTNLAWLKRECEKTQNFAELLAVALRELKKFTGGSEIVCGPISTGGRGSIEENLKVFTCMIAALRFKERDVFDQMPYEGQIFNFRQRWIKEDSRREGTYYTEILSEFYLPLFTSGLIRAAWFLPGWQSSDGASWEHDRLTEFGVEIYYLDEASVVSALGAAA